MTTASATTPAPISSYLEILMSPKFPREQGTKLAELAELLTSRPELIQKPLYRANLSSKGIGVSNMSNMSNMIGNRVTAITPLGLAQSAEVVYILLSYGADLNAEVMYDRGVDITPLVMFCAVYQEWKLPLLFRFSAGVIRDNIVIPGPGIRLSHPQHIPSEIIDSPLTLSYLIREGIPFNTQELHDIGADLHTYWIWHAVLEGDNNTSMLSLLPADSHPLLFKLFVCYGLDVDSLPPFAAQTVPSIEAAFKMQANTTKAISSKMQADIIKAIQEYRERLTSMNLTGTDLFQELLKQPYEILQDLNIHGLNPYWEDEEFWRQKSKRDITDVTGRVVTNRYVYFQWYSSVKIGRYHTHNYEESLGAALTFYLAPASAASNIFTVQVLGIELDAPRGRKASSSWVLNELFGLHDTLTEGLQASASLNLLRYKDQERMSSHKYTLEIDEVVVQFDSIDFLYGVLVSIRVLNRKPSEILGRLVSLSFD